MKLKKPRFWDEKVGLVSIILLPLSLIVLVIVFLKRKFIQSKEFEIPIICVGNIYLGGTGKTPLCILLGQELKKLGRKPAILRKYYKNHMDEHELIKENYKDLVLSNNRIEGIKISKNNNYDSIILDDGFQDHTIKKDINIICFNQNQLIGNGLIIPSGPLRENLNSLKRANFIVINGEKNINFENKILKINNKLQFFYTNYNLVNIEDFKNKKLLAIAGIGNPENFFKCIERHNLRIEKKLIFPDHYSFSKYEVQKILDEAERKNLHIIMTEKDYFKMKNLTSKKIKYIKISLSMNNKEKLIAEISKLYDKDN